MARSGARAPHGRRGGGAIPLLAALLSWSALAPLHAVPIERLRSPRPAHWVLDTTGTLSHDDVARIDARVEELRRRTGGEVVVVLIDSTDGIPPSDYAPKLANAWLVGDQARRDGVLILLAKTDRRVEITLGKGIAGERQSEIAQDILERFMAPRLRVGDFKGGIFAGLQGVAERVFDDPGHSAEPGVTEVAAAPLPPGTSDEVGAPAAEQGGLPWAPTALVLVLLALGGGLALRARRRGNETKHRQKP